MRGRMSAKGGSAYGGKKIFYTILISLFLPSFVLAAPSISGISGNITHGSQVTVLGSGFGTKTLAAPKLWDKVENTWNLNNGQSIPQFTSPWTGDSLSTYSTQEQRTPLSTANYFNANNTKNFVNGFYMPGATKAYLSWWWKSDNSTEEQGKFLRISEYTDYINRTWSWGNEGTYLYVNGDCQLTTGGSVLWSDTILSANVWHFMEAWFDGPGKNWTVRADGASRGTATWTTCNWNPDYVWLVGVDSGGTNPKSQTSRMDDIYVDSSWSRVMLGNASAYSGCTKFEMQYPSLWATNSVALTVNQGSFTSGQQAYLYVVDSNGEVSANGFPVTIGGGGDTTPPGSPANLTIR